MANFKNLMDNVDETYQAHITAMEAHDTYSMKLFDDPNADLTKDAELQRLQKAMSDTHAAWQAAEKAFDDAVEGNNGAPPEAASAIESMGANPFELKPQFVDRTKIPKQSQKVEVHPSSAEGVINKLKRDSAAVPFPARKTLTPLQSAIVLAFPKK